MKTEKKEIFQTGVMSAMIYARGVGDKIRKRKKQEGFDFGSSCEPGKNSVGMVCTNSEQTNYGSDNFQVVPKTDYE